MYFSDDWRNLQETMLYKIPPRTLNTTEIAPKNNGHEELEIFQLPKSSLPIILYIALKAQDKSGNDGKLSNIVQVPFMLEDTFNKNITKVNDTNNNTDTRSNNIEKNSHIRNIYIAISSASIVALLIIIINILIWLLCFRRQKRIYKARMIDLYESSTKFSTNGTNIHSDENILRSEVENTQKDSSTSNQDCDNSGTNNPMLMYAKIQKRDKNQSTNTTDRIVNSRNQLFSNHKESELGFV